MATGKIQEAKKTLADTLNEITFKNAQAQKINAIQKGRERLKDSLGRNKRRVADVPKVQGLETVKNTLGKQLFK